MKRRRNPPARPKRLDPTPEEIAERSREIRSEWSPLERWRRLRIDLRPHYIGLNGERHEMRAEAYDEHHERPKLEDDECNTPAD